MLTSLSRKLTPALLAASLFSCDDKATDSQTESALDASASVTGDASVGSQDSPQGSEELADNDALLGSGDDDGTEASSTGATADGSSGDTATSSSRDSGAGGNGSMAGDAALLSTDELTDLGGTEALPGGGFVTVTTDDNDVIEILCGTETCQCADGIDNDGDGLVDGNDNECTGPFDHNEATFATGVPGDNRDPIWQDCFFDGNSGAGDDGCRYHADCLTGDKEQTDDKCAVSQECIDNCQPLTVPGCDCFGCCEVSHDGETLGIVASESCSIAEIDDEQACPRCEFSDQCGNPCGECEICVGKTRDDLPASCFDIPENPDETGSGGTGSGGAPGEPSGSGGDSGEPSGSGGSSATGGTPGDEPAQPAAPGNSCDGDARACLESSDCEFGQFCGFGCCVVVDPQLK